MIAKVANNLLFEKPNFMALQYWLVLVNNFYFGLFPENNQTW
jgi:hypothetical protein